MKHFQQTKRGRWAGQIKKVFVDSLFPQSTFADMLLFFWAFLIAAVARHNTLLAHVRRAVFLVRSNIADDFNEAHGMLDMIVALGHGLGLIASYLWLTLIVVIALAIPLSTIISEALHPCELTVYEKKDLSFTVRFFYAGLALTGIFIAAYELFFLMQAPRTGWTAVFNIALVGFVSLQRGLAFSLVVCVDEEDSWVRGFFASRIAITQVKKPIVLLSLPAAVCIFYLAGRMGCSTLWAVFLTYAYTGIIMQLANTLVEKLTAPHGAAK
ncbi:MAG: hypothetical protein JW976_09725 [Syntrophaceae bacterium]|nr:hypothetical protein [Syntrophaceae bacterium]